VGLLTGEFPDKLSRVGISLERELLEQIQPVSLAVGTDDEMLPRISMGVEDMHHLMVEWPLTPCSERAGGGPFVWRGKLTLDLDISWMIGMGLPFHSQHSPSLQAAVEARAFNNQPPGCSDLVVF
jgi:hypothetical protein